MRLTACCGKDRPSADTEPAVGKGGDHVPICLPGFGCDRASADGEGDD